MAKKKYRHYYCTNCGVDEYVRIDHIKDRESESSEDREWKRQIQTAVEKCDCGEIAREITIFMGQCSRCDGGAETEIGSLRFCEECAEEVNEYVYG